MVNNATEGRGGRDRMASGFTTLHLNFPCKCGFGCLAPLLTTFILYRRRKPECMGQSSYLSLSAKTNVVSSTPLYESLKGFELTTLVAIVTDCTGNCKSNYHTIIATTAPHIVGIGKNIYFYQLVTHLIYHLQYEGPSWQLSYGSWIYNYLCNQ
jgi:hypothetical protein